MQETYTSLTGRWMGRFEYDRGGVASSFEAEITETGTALDGDTTEPNNFRKDMGSELTATLTGSRADGHVSFVKRYNGFDQGDLLLYDGTVNAALSRIEGRWRFSAQPGWGGRFVMFRKAQSKAKAKTKATVDIEV